LPSVTTGRRRSSYHPAEVPDAFDRAFRFQLSACEVAATGKAIDWPAAPMTVTGSFTALPATVLDPGHQPLLDPIGQNVAQPVDLRRGLASRFGPSASSH
jgi:hypothetical protein